MKYKFHWLTGKEEILSGRSAADALNKAGYGAGALRALDFYEPVEKKKLRGETRIAVPIDDLSKWDEK